MAVRSGRKRLAFKTVAVTTDVTATGFGNAGYNGTYTRIADFNAQHAWQFAFAGTYLYYDAGNDGYCLDTVLGTDQQSAAYGAITAGTSPFGPYSPNNDTPPGGTIS